MIITPSNILTTCPNCQAKLILQKMFSEIDTQCPKCNYVEPAGSAHFVTFITQVLTEFLTTFGVKSLSLAGSDIPSIEGALQANSLLPAIVINAHINSKHCGTALSSLNLTTVDDDSGFYKKRVITNSSQIRSPGLSISALAETLICAFHESKKNPSFSASNTLCLDLIAPISAMQVDNIIIHAQQNEQELKIESNDIQIYGV